MRFPVGSITRMQTGANNKHIRDALENRFVLKEALKQSKQVAYKFKGKTELETCKNVWNYLRHNVRYYADKSDQNIKLPLRLMKDGVGDCKSYTLFAWAVLTALGFPCRYVYTSYSGDPTPSHVYLETNSGIIVDGVFHQFNAEEKYTYRKTKKV